MLKEVKIKDFQKDLSKKRKLDSPLRMPMHVEMWTTHEERISWLYYENSCIAEEYVSAKLLYALGKIRLQEKDNEQFISLERYRAVKEAFNLWEEANEAKDLNDEEYRRHRIDFYNKYHIPGQDDDCDD